MSQTNHLNKKIDLANFDKELSEFVEDRLLGPHDAHKGGKHLHRTEHELNQTATETEDEESEQEDIHDPQTGSIYSTPVGSTTGSIDEEYLEADNVEAVEPKGTSKSWRKRKTKDTKDSGNLSENSDTPISQLKKQQVGKTRIRQVASKSMGGD